MIEIKLVFPTVMISKEEELANLLQVDKDFLRQIINGESCIIPKGETEWDVRSLVTHDENNSTSYEIFNAENELRYMDAIRRIGSIRNVDVEPFILSSIKLPKEVFRCGSERTQKNLMWLANRIISRNRRLEKLESLKAPDIILYCERRMLRDYIEQFENSDYGMGLKDFNGRTIRSLKDVGYSIMYGFDKEEETSELCNFNGKEVG